MDTGLYRDALEPFEREIDELLPAGAEVFEAHTHLGLDEDGRSLDLPTLLAQLDQARASGACVFPLHDPDRRPAYTVPNDRVLAWAGESDGRLVPFCRLDPAEGPLREAERCVALGARGIKLHPRAQDFRFDSPEMTDIFAFAEESRIPILIHTGRGMPPIADDLCELALRHPGAALILAHGAICDQGILTARLREHPAVFYDTSCFFPVDVIELLARASAERVVFASDPPYGLPAAGLYLLLRVARHASIDGDTLRLMLAGSMRALLDGRDLPAPAAPRRGEQIALPGRLARVTAYISIVGPALFGGAVDQAKQMLSLAIAACRDPDPGRDGPELAAVGAALTAALGLLEEEDGGRAAFDLIYRANARAATALPAA